VGDLSSIFGVAVRSIRAERGYSQEELADRAGLHRTYISDVERGARNPSLESIEKLARALELSVAHLFERASSGEESAKLIEILLVEDNSEDAELAKRAFHRAHIANPVTVVGDGAEALDFLFARGSFAWRKQSPLPGLILLDLHLPKLRGQDVLRSIKAAPATHDIPVVVLTICAGNADIEECLKLGARAYIVKPISFHNLGEITPHVDMQWALVRPPARQIAGAG